MDRGAWQVTVHGAVKCQTRLNNFHFTSPQGKLNKAPWDIPGGPVVKTLLPSAGGAGSIPGQGTKNPHAWQPKTKT